MAGFPPTSRPMKVRNDDCQEDDRHPTPDPPNHSIGFDLYHPKAATVATAWVTHSIEWRRICGSLIVRRRNDAAGNGNEALSLSRGREATLCSVVVQESELLSVQFWARG